MHPLFRLSLCALAVTLSAQAQNTIVSPAGNDVLEGNTQNSFPWASTVLRRYTQIHDDIGGSPKVITKISFRVGQGTTNYTNTRDLDMELLMGHGGPYPNWSFTFANNYKSGPVTAIARKIVKMGPQGQAMNPGPSPFTANMDLVLDAPFVYNGVDSLIWDAAIHAVTVTGTGSFGSPDADTGAATTGSAGTNTGTENSDGNRHRVNVSLPTAAPACRILDAPWAHRYSRRGFQLRIQPLGSSRPRRSASAKHGTRWNALEHFGTFGRHPPDARRVHRRPGDPRHRTRAGRRHDGHPPERRTATPFRFQTGTLRMR
jgi:hypothetical protein